MLSQFNLVKIEVYVSQFNLLLNILLGWPLFSEGYFLTKRWFNRT